ncbi:MAG: hypothetical protein COB24_03135 [Hyphomicrobiales bacterium]|nr:MAG: hypothetical protein COB24_03135 [Hyphomicrobiales bacterium]
MNEMRKMLPNINQVRIGADLNALKLIKEPECAAVILLREPISKFTNWIDELDVEMLPAAKEILRPESVRKFLVDICKNSGLENGPECAHLIDNITRLSDAFSELVDSSFIRIRLEKITTNACKKFHIDNVKVRLVCTYRGTGTQYGCAKNGENPENIYTVPTGCPFLMRGRLWSDEADSELVHRSPPIEGLGQTRLLLVIDPIFER